MSGDHVCAFCGATVPAADLPFVIRHREKLLCRTCAPTILGSEIDGWYVERILGEGGLGVVYIVRHLASGKHAAMKVLKVNRTAPQDLKRFRREAQTLAALEHPHVLRVYGAGNHEGRPYLLLQLAVNGSLSELCTRGRLPLAWTARALAQVARGLEYCHAQGYIHRDVKPGNIFFDGEWAALLGDFGLVRFGGTGFAASGLTRPGGVTGSPAYMPPEQIANASKAEPASDVWSLGVTLYEALTTRLPFRGKTPLQLFTRIREGHYEPASSICAEVPSEIDRLLAQVLRHEAAERPTAREVAATLERVAIPEPGAPSAVGPPDPEGGLVDSETRTRLD